MKKLNVPKLSNDQISFSSINTDKDLLSIANEKEKDLKNYAKLFNELFFNGGKLHFKENIDEDYKNDLTRYLKALMSSFMPKHEHKQAVCSLILSELVDICKYPL